MWGEAGCFVCSERVCVCALSVASSFMLRARPYTTVGTRGAQLVLTLGG